MSAFTRLASCNLNLLFPDPRVRLVFSFFSRSCNSLLFIAQPLMLRSHLEKFIGSLVSGTSLCTLFCADFFPTRVCRHKCLRLPCLRLSLASQRASDYYSRNPSPTPSLLLSLLISRLLSRSRDPLWPSISCPGCVADPREKRRSREDQRQCASLAWLSQFACRRRRCSWAFDSDLLLVSRPPFLLLSFAGSKESAAAAGDPRFTR